MPKAIMVRRIIVFFLPEFSALMIMLFVLTMLHIVFKKMLSFVSAERVECDGLDVAFAFATLHTLRAMLTRHSFAFFAATAFEALLTIY